LLDTRKLIGNLEAHGGRVMSGKVLLGAHVPCLEDAIKVVRMWEALQHTCNKHAISDDIKKGIRYIVSHIEGTYFPSIIKQTVTVEIQGADEQRLRNTISTIECVDGVKEVRT